MDAQGRLTALHLEVAQTISLRSMRMVVVRGPAARLSPPMRR
jgi:hypothetical protein